jgi:hypothetical protein
MLQFTCTVHNGWVTNSQRTTTQTLRDSSYMTKPTPTSMKSKCKSWVPHGFQKHIVNIYLATLEPSPVSLLVYK